MSLVYLDLYFCNHFYKNLILLVGTTKFASDSNKQSQECIISCYK